ncbi:Nuclease Le1 [Mycena chlorophos]|uniref:Nuclease Le1 n=1 Tax=Mycena chlorophos TaxID=658473 RepID=A0A8H6WNJ8_MYCCL|nr:Nuclease Le1 [Mycena chlorophos]
MKGPFALLGATWTLVGGVYGWGAVGHQAIGYIAMQFLSPKALELVQTSLGTTYSGSLGPAAPWADQVRSLPAYSWSAPYHFVDSEDNPPTSCSVSESRDCGNGACVLGAIANYTMRVVDAGLSDMQRQEALKFLDHFIGDVTQPLHVEARALGGNQISVRCNGASTSLHAMWDTGIITKFLVTNYSNSVTTWADALAARLKSRAFNGAPVSSFVSCSSVTEPVKRSIYSDIATLSSLNSDALDSRTITPLACPLAWAQDANKLDCSYVFKYTPGTDLCTGSYYDGAVPIIETQIAKAGYRLAGWLNVLFDGTLGLPH